MFIDVLLHCRKRFFQHFLSSRGIYNRDGYEYFIRAPKRGMFATESISLKRPPTLRNSVRLHVPIETGPWLKYILNNSTIINMIKIIDKLGEILQKNTSIGVSYSMDLDETPSYSVSHPSQRFLHRTSNSV